MTLQKPKSRFLPTLTEVVRPGDALAAANVLPEDVPASAAGEIQRALAPEVEADLRERLHAALDAQILEMLPRMHDAIDAAVDAALANAQARRNAPDH
jgi:hypothetical protein